jgi:hypothetical protein
MAMTLSYACRHGEVEIGSGSPLRGRAMAQPWLYFELIELGINGCDDKHMLISSDPHDAGVMHA